MRLLHVPLDRLRALARACPGLLEAVTSVVQSGADPAVKVLRVATTGEPPRWYIAVGERVLVFDSTDLAGMAALAPIFFVDLVAEVRAELAQLFEDGTLDAELAKIVPFGPKAARGEMPS